MQAADYAAWRDFRLLQHLATDRRAFAVARRLGIPGRGQPLQSGNDRMRMDSKTHGPSPPPPQAIVAGDEPSEEYHARFESRYEKGGRGKGGGKGGGRFFVRYAGKGGSHAQTPSHTYPSNGR